MSFREERYLGIKDSNFKNLPEYEDPVHARYDDEAVRKILNHGIHGICFSPYEEGQEPGDVITEAQVRRRLSILEPHIKWIRSFSCTEGNEHIPKMAKELGIKTLVGAWLGDDLEKNEEEIAGLIALGKAGLVDIAAVGNEVLYRKDLEEEKLLEYIERVKQELPDIPVGYVDAYYEFTERPAITEACEIILCNCYPFWEGTHLRDAFNHMRHMYYQAKGVAGEKRVVITETGWPTEGDALGGAEPSRENAKNYFVSANLWSINEGIEMFYFSSFDEAWKVGSEGSVGAFWGIWDKDENLKF